MIPIKPSFRTILSFRDINDQYYKHIATCILGTTKLKDNILYGNIINDRAYAYSKDYTFLSPNEIDAFYQIHREKNHSYEIEEANKMKEYLIYTQLQSPEFISFQKKDTMNLSLVVVSYSNKPINKYVPNHPLILQETTGLLRAIDLISL